MSNSTTLLDTISTAQSNKEAVANALFDAASPATIWGRHASATNLLTWGYYGGMYYTTAGANPVANGTLTLTASTTNFIFANATTGAVSVNTTGFPAGSIPLYTVVTNATTVTSYTDERSYQPSAVGGGGGGSGTVTSVAGAGGVESATGAITTSGTLRSASGLAGGAIATAAYTFVTTDRGKTLIMNSASSVTQTLPAPTGATLTTNFPTGWWAEVQNIGAGTMTLGVPSGVNLDGVANGTVTLAQGTGLKFFTDGTNYFTMRGAAAGGGGGSSTFAGLSDVSVVSPLAGQLPVYNATTGKWTNTTPGTGNQFFSFVVPSNSTPSTSAFAWKGNIYNCQEACSVTGVSSVLNTVSGQTYQACVVLLSATGFTLAAAPVFSTAITVTTGATAATLQFVFPTPAPLTAGQNYGIMIGCTTEGNTYVLPQMAAQGTWPSTPFLSTSTIIRLAQATPASGQTYDNDSGTITSNALGVSIQVSPQSVGTSCAFSAVNTSAQSIPASGSFATVTGWTAVEDNSSGAMNFSTGVFTAPYTGWYSVAAAALFSSAVWVSGQNTQIRHLVNGSAGETFVSSQPAGTFNAQTPSGAAIIYMAAGSTLAVQVAQGTASALALNTAAGYTNFSVAFVAAGVSLMPGAAPVSITNYAHGLPVASGILLRELVPVACTLPAGLTGSGAVCDVAPTAAVVCPITHNGTNVGSVNFAAGATTGTFTFASAVNIADGDIVQVTAPSSVDTTFAGVAIGLQASAPAVSSNTTLASLGDVNITSPTDGQMMVYSGVLGKWVNTSEDDGSGFVDGNFDFWDIATSVAVSTTDVYTADMWLANSGTGGAATVSQVARTLGSEPSYMTRPSKYQLQWAQTTAATASPTLGEKIEGVGTYNGQTITVQASLVAAAAGVDVVGIRATQYFGTGGSPSASVVTTQTVAWSVTTTEQKFSDTIAIPSITGKTLGTSGTDYLRIDLLMATGATFTLKYSQLQIDPSPAGFNATNVGTGGVPKAFRYRGVASEKVRVQRYLFTLAMNAGAGYLAGLFTSATQFYCFIFLPTAMRATGTASFTGGAPTANGGGSTSSGTATPTASGSQSLQILIAVTGATSYASGYLAGGTGGTMLIVDSRLTV